MHEQNRWRWSADEIKRVGYQAVDLIAKHLTTLPDRPVFQPFPAELADSLMREAPPEHALTPDEVLTRFSREIEPWPFGNGHPRFFGWVNSPPDIMGIFGEALAAAMDPSCAGGNHAAIFVEHQVVNWFKTILNYPAESKGLLVSGSSVAALTALAVARHVKCGWDVRAKGLQQAPSRLVLYKTSEGHACHQKAAELLGIGSENVRIIDHDKSYRMHCPALAAAIERDVEEGNTPVAVIASAGTVNTGAIDPLHEIADICQAHNVWLHVDGAYGAPAIITDAYREPLSALARADSIALDPHKWLYVPVEAGLVMIRDADAQRAAFSLVPPYLRTDGNLTGVSGPPWISEYGIQQTRGFRALKIWMALQHRGLEGYRQSIRQDIALAGRLAEILRSADDFEVCEPQSLSIVCFRYVPQHLKGQRTELNDCNKRLAEKIQLGGKAFLSTTVLNETFWLRCCIVNPRTSVQDIEALVDIVRFEAGA